MGSSRRDDSNGGGYAPLGSTDVEMFDETQLKNIIIGVFSAPSDRGDAKHGSLESSCGDESIGSGFALLGSIGVEISDET